ncbi:MAG: glutamate synthase large subunit [Alphaproteobacteria bacterium]|nr:glutamate synthase large subunit [Alphaproteobacteria bacterium]MDA7988291.1 glutamate synthase large subunit [Alphaproteobacteria bacterium]MDA8008692.1 glutamate synthase large subunit [Alphaproteobacteria bacterium]
MESLIRSKVMDNYEQQKREATRLAQHGLYNPAEEHDSCGVGFIAAINGKPSRQVVTTAINALRAVWHRGAVDADGKTGDGAGIHIAIPHNFFQEQIKRTGHKPSDKPLAIGVVFLPRADLEAQERSRVIVEREILALGYTVLGWRQVPVNTSVIGEKANRSRPEIEQIIIAGNNTHSADDFELNLYIARRRMERAAAKIPDFYICSLSCRSIIYKGMFLAEQLSNFYPDLQDERFQSNFAIFHQRFSTNTFPTWPLAQPFRILAHNGEINTFSGNTNWMRVHEARLSAQAFAEHLPELLPVIPPRCSDSAGLDAAMELVVRGGRDLPMAKTLMIPEAWRQNSNMPQAWKDLYLYCNAVMEPWDGPAAICGYDGRWALAGMDRNGLRPLRYSLTKDGLIFCGSESGMVRLDESEITEKGRLGPGEMIAVDLENGSLWKDRPLKDALASRRDFGRWSRAVHRIDEALQARDKRRRATRIDGDNLRRLLTTFGHTQEELELILHPMAADGKEPVGSMGDDTPLAVLSREERELHHFFRQKFSQVTNPPIDSLRERRVMSLVTRLGNLGNVLDESEGQCDIFELQSPVLTNDEADALAHWLGESATELDCTFAAAEADDASDAGGAETALGARLEELQKAAEAAVREGRGHLILSNRAVSAGRAPVPMILAAGAVQARLTRSGLRSFASLNVRSGELLDVHNAAVLVGIGATTVNAWLSEEALRARHSRGLFGDATFDAVTRGYVQALNEGLLKVMSKLGIAVISSYRAGLNFEAVGLSRSLVDSFFPGMASRISGIGLQGIQRRVLARHRRGFGHGEGVVPVGGLYRFRAGSESHNWRAEIIHKLQRAVSGGSYREWKIYSDACRALPPASLRDLMDFRETRPLPIEEVEAITAIRRRFVTPGMSLGALSPEAHSTLNVAMNRIGAKSDSGEGGENPEHFKPRANGDNANSAIKQIASGRFGVTAEYLNQCREIEIKIAQGAKPGEGGQLPGFKVTETIARLRHSTPGVMLISPPPHHDIYSIEDLAQLIYDLKQINPDARVCVKLVARSGVGTIAAGVAKAHADVILISGHSGGTGASPQSSIKYAGVPWELGLAETHQVLSLNRLRGRVLLRTDGGLRTGRDIVIAAMLGAEEYGIGTASLVSMGCLMVRQCHSNTCPVGVCTQREDLRERFTGSAEKVVNLFSLMAEEVREILSELGFGSLQEVIGRTDLLQQVSRGDEALDDLDLNPLLVRAEMDDDLPPYGSRARVEVPDTLDAEILRDAEPVFRVGEKMQLDYAIRNTDRTVGARVSSALVRRYGPGGLPRGHLTLRLRGTAGQSLGAWLMRGVKIELLGDANDYVGKGLSGGVIVIRPPSRSVLRSHENTIIGNTVLYGATGGELYASGQAGERFCVRNSGARVVVEGCGSNGCEYMTGGVAVLLGEVGNNFAAGMTGGVAFVYDPYGTLEERLNGESVGVVDVADEWRGVLREMVERHSEETRSLRARDLLRHWEESVFDFRQVVPLEMSREMLSRMAEASLEARA